MKSRLKEIKGVVLKKFKKYFSTNILFSTYVGVSLLLGGLLRYFTLGIESFFGAFFVDFVVVVVIGAFGYLFKPKNQFYYFFSLIILYTFLTIVNSIYHMFYMSFISINLLSTLKMVGTVGDSVTSKLQLTNFIYLIGPVIMYFVHRNLSKKNYYYEVGKDEKGKKMYKNTTITALIIFALIVVTLNKAEISRFVKQWNREFIVQRFGIYAYTINDVTQSLEPKISSMFGYDESARVFRDFYNNKEYFNENNKYSNIFKDKNVIFIHAESIQTFLIDLKVNDIEITPNLNRLSKEGMYFSNFYPQISVGTSSDTEFTLLTGLMPASSGTVFVSYFDRTYEGMPQLFNDMGYYTFSMHANNADYWNRKVMHNVLGYNTFFAKDSYEYDPETQRIVLGLNDKDFFKQSIEKLKTIKSENEKFMGTIITLSNHSPFDELEKYGNLDFSIKYNKEIVDDDGNVSNSEVIVPYLENTEMGNYLKSVHYADEALGEFFNSLVTEGLDENTVVVIYGDHDARLGKKQFNILYNYDVTTGEIKDEDDPTFITIDNYVYDLMKNTPLIIWSSDSDIKKEITDVMGMYDVLPTIANMFGFESDYALGNDIFSDSEKIVIFPNGNFLTNKVYYNSLREEYILLSNEPIEANYIERLKLYAEERLEVSKSIIVHNLMKTEVANLERNKE